MGLAWTRPPDYSKLPGREEIHDIPDRGLPLGLGLLVGATAGTVAGAAAAGATADAGAGHA